MDLLDLLILALRIVLVALLYLFLASVMRMAASGLRPRRTRGVVEPVPVPVPVLSLVVLESGSSDLVPGQAVELKDAAILGRADRADVVLADPAISSEHARVSRVGRAWVISDLGSTNGTRLNDRRVDGDVPLAQGDVVALGNVRFRVGTR